MINQYKNHINDRKLIMTSQSDDPSINDNDVIITADPRLSIPKIEFN